MKVKNFHANNKMTENNDIVMEEYFERDVKHELDSNMELERSKKLKHEFLSDGKEVKEEYFEIDVTSEFESDVEIDEMFIVYSISFIKIL